MGYRCVRVRRADQCSRNQRNPPAVGISERPRRIIAAQSADVQAAGGTAARESATSRLRAPTHRRGSPFRQRISAGYAGSRTAGRAHPASDRCACCTLRVRWRGWPCARYTRYQCAPAGARSASTPSHALPRGARPATLPSAPPGAGRRASARGVPDHAAGSGRPHESPAPATLASPVAALQHSWYIGGPGCRSAESLCSSSMILHSHS
jgi:hypothetical protein